MKKGILKLVLIVGGFVLVNTASAQVSDTVVG